MSNQYLPAQFDTYSEARREGFIRIMELKQKLGKKVVGTFCSYTPSELIMAAGAIPVGLCGSSEDGIAYAERHLPKNLCPLIKASYGLAASDTCLYFYFSDMVLAETTCDGKQKMYELLGELKPVHVMRLPTCREAPGAAESWYAEILRAKAALERQLEVTITEEAVRDAIRRKNRLRRATAALYEVARLNPSPVSGYELSTIIEATDFMFMEEEKLALLQRRTEEFLARYAALRGGPARPRILLSGCPTTGVRDKLIGRLEALGADVVGFESCCGPRSQKDLVDEDGDPYRALAEKYLRVNCSVMSPNRGRLEALDEMLRDYQIDGVVEVVLQSCHTFAVESHAIKRFVTQERGLPYLCIETDYSQADAGQMSTRLSAFLEVLGI